jgi:hypothetical protein
MPAGIAADYGQASFWDRPVADSLRIAWGTTLHGYVFRFAVRGDSLAGTYTHTARTWMPESSGAPTRPSSCLPNRIFGLRTPLGSHALAHEVRVSRRQAAGRRAAGGGRGDLTLTREKHRRTAVREAARPSLGVAIDEDDDREAFASKSHSADSSMRLDMGRWVMPRRPRTRWPRDFGAEHQAGNATRAIASRTAGRSA